MPPLPVTLFVLILLGYPLAQIAAIRLRRPKRLRFNTLIGEMTADRTLQGHTEQAALAELMAFSRGSPLIALAPVILPAVAVAVTIGNLPTRREAESLDTMRVRASFASSFDDLPTDSPLWKDERLGDALDMSIDLSFWKWPISMLIAIIASLPFAISSGCYAWIRNRTVEVLEPRGTTDRLARVLHSMGT